MIENLQLYDAKVISIEDSSSEGRIQIQVLPELEDITSTDDFPWAIPFSSKNSASKFENHLPEVGSIVRVLIRSDWQRFYYLSNKFFVNLFDFSKVTSALGEVGDTSLDTTYKYLDFTYYEDGGLNFHNSSTGEHGYIHATGTYTVFDKSGNIYANSSTHEITLKNSGGITIDAGTGDMSLTGKNITLNGTTSLAIKSASTTFSGGTVTATGTATPNMLGGWCAITVCPLSGAPHSSSILKGS